MAVILRTRVTLTYGSGGPGLATFYWSPGTVGGSVADANDCVGRVRTMLVATAPSYAAPMSMQVQNDVAALEATTGVLTGLFSATPVTAVAGSGAGGPNPTAAQLLVRSRTAVIINGRLLRGRHFMGPVVATTLGAGGAVVAGTITIFDGAFNAMIPAGATTSAPAVWHRPTPLATGGHGLVSSYSTWNQFAVLRSRRDA